MVAAHAHRGRPNTVTFMSTGSVDCKVAQHQLIKALLSVRISGKTSPKHSVRMHKCIIGQESRKERLNTPQNTAGPEGRNSSKEMVCTVQLPLRLKCSAVSYFLSGTQKVQHALQLRHVFICEKRSNENFGKFFQYHDAHEPGSRFSGRVRKCEECRMNRKASCGTGCLCSRRYPSSAATFVTTFLDVRRAGRQKKANNKAGINLPSPS